MDAVNRWRAAMEDAMRSSTDVIGSRANGSHRLRVVDDRVDCTRIGLIPLERCRECVYLVGLERVGDGCTTTRVLCLSGEPPEEPGFAW
jgi:hypothetical protein